MFFSPRCNIESVCVCVGGDKVFPLQNQRALRASHSCNGQFALTFVEIVHIQNIWLTSSDHRLERCEVVIPSMIMRSSCDSFNSSKCVVAACGLEKSKRNLTGHEAQLRLDKLDNISCD